MIRTIDIRRWDNNKLIFSYTCENNTLAKTVEKAVNLGLSLAYADLYRARLIYLNLANVDLNHANLNFANLQLSNLDNANLSYCNLNYSSFRSCNLARAKLISCSLSNTDFSNANLSLTKLTNSHLLGVSFFNTNLNKIKLNRTELKSVNFTCAYNIFPDYFKNTKGINDQCPKEGSFIGWKKCYGNENKKVYIVKLEIPVDAKRSSATTNKCRCSKAKVLEIQNLNGNKTNVKIATSAYDRQFKYHVNNIIEEPNFDDRYWVECTHGIHFFMNREDAVNYLF